MNDEGRFSSSPESSMDNDGSDKHHRLQTLTKASSTTATTADGHSHGGEDDSENSAVKRDAELWSTFTENIRQVQSVLDRNSALIQQANENHRSKIRGNLVKNVALIQEINGNISKAASLYSDLSVNFSNMFHQRNGEVDAKSSNGKAGSDHELQRMTAGHAISSSTS